MRSRRTICEGFLAWGEPIATQPLAVTVIGLPGFAAVSTGNPAEAETAGGSLERGTNTGSDECAVNLATGGHADGRTVRRIVVARSGKLLEGRRLTAVPSARCSPAPVSVRSSFVISGACRRWSYAV